MNFNHSGYLCGWLCVIFVFNYEKKMSFFFGIKMVIYLIYNIYNLVKIVEPLMKLI